MKPSITNSSDFLFVYEAIQCNPNGDPDQENKPRMDYDTKTNLVTDTRVKRFIRDYLKASNEDEIVFVDMEGDSKVSVDSKLKAVVKRTVENEGELEKAFENDSEALKVYKEIIAKEKDAEGVWKTITDKKFKQKEVNYELLAYLVKEKFLDIRMFGSAFAVGGFTKAYTGPIQLNWGYSFNKVELIDSSSIVTIMNDDSSTFGKDYRVHYSLLGFNGTINAPAAKTTGLATDDVLEFRKAIWESIPASPTRSKLNQYPKLYLEIVYNEGVSNGQFGDLRNFVETQPKEGITDKQVRKFKDLSIDLSALKTLIAQDKSGEHKIKEIILKTSADFDFSL
ncbi:CRISPR-associated protein, Csh2 family [Zunongwangia profunda SM-A87]|uniref:CRISPR-associated protein, Csh2 family n=1 Tax=Zunongwangia profunda (strain DSM 18752 / CCTCC AB 206139 / SM-A87) TaxID=655815 RepID=D5BKW3_ZUNPS|nr:CRISPR-associated protein [Zunongwangia profunda]ADF51862.1 CRISPR-associated protein, Csh2 family [Zunongwangia profunda SM-A87]